MTRSAHWNPNGYWQADYDDTPYRTLPGLRRVWL